MSNGAAASGWSEVPSLSPALMVVKVPTCSSSVRKGVAENLTMSLFLLIIIYNTPAGCRSAVHFFRFMGACNVGPNPRGADKASAQWQVF